jgi:hypothetical protein
MLSRLAFENFYIKSQRIMTLTVVYRCETWSLTSKHEPQTEKLYNLYSSPDSKDEIGRTCITQRGNKKIHKGKRNWRPSRRWEDNISMDIA